MPEEHEDDKYIPPQNLPDEKLMAKVVESCKNRRPVKEFMTGSISEEDAKVLMKDV